MMRIAVLAPIKVSLYSRLVTHLAALEPGVKITDIIVRTPWTWKRIHEEIRRDRFRLVQKVYDKMVLGEKAYDEMGEDTLPALARRVDLPGKTLEDVARAHGIRLTTTKDQNDARSQAILKNSRVDVIAFTGGGLIRKPILQIPRLGVLNCHMGLLPRYRGMDVVEWPVIDPMEGERNIGLTLHFMDEGVDTGPILLRHILDLHPGDHFASIRTRLETLMVQLVIDGIRGLRDGHLVPKPQNPRDGRQYYVMHPRIMEYAKHKLQGRLNGHPPSQDD
jgi:methionyl-tRNA formyltransferase